ncbi:restriction endonuclease subunit S [Halomonas urmiana]|uniref:Restriction endonuclease subunit S n=1 Tax=Halomonas urmiana TaxID=490901 RepID=A0A5R8MCN8_9GAMM|nr:restriction endonuclease subunit S [Halomonas urmiana]TLF47285.1 restriction endonuclease subunit S [Halomonas urmiana]
MSEHALPSWSRVNLTDLAAYINGYAFKPEDWSEHGLPIVRIAQITGSSADCDYYQGRLSEDFKIDNGEIIFSWSGTLCVVQWNGGPAWLNQHLFKVKPAEGVSHRLLYHVLFHAVAEMDKSAHGSTMKHIKRSELKRYELLFPNSRKEQEKIGRVLDTLDTQIQKTEALIAKLEKVKEGMLHDLLTRGIDENGRLRSSPEQAPELYKESPLGLIPKEWGVEKLKDLSSNGMINGVFKEVSRAGIGTPLINVADLYKGDDINLGTCERFDANEVEVGKYDALPGDVFFTRSSLKLEGIAHCNWLKIADKPAVFECHIIRVRPSSKVDPRFLVAWCLSSNARLHFMGNAKQVTMTTISQDGVGSLPCPVPSIDEQKKASERILSLERRVADEKLKLSKLSNQKQGLMDDLLIGRVRVTPLLDQAQITTPA